MDDDNEASSEWMDNDDMEEKETMVLNPTSVRERIDVSRSEIMSKDIY
jgi:hypothetical protein